MSVQREEVEADLSDDVTASCYNRQITRQALYSINVKDWMRKC